MFSVLVKGFKGRLSDPEVHDVLELITYHDMI